MNKKFYFICQLIFLTVTGLSNGDMSGLNTIIPRLDINTQEPSQVFIEINDLAKRAGALENGFRGIVVEDKIELKGQFAELHLINIPLGKLIDIVSEQFGLIYHPKDGIVFVAQSKPEATTYFELNHKVRDALGLAITGQISADQIFISLKNINMNLEKDLLRVVGDSVIVSAKIEEIEFLKSFLRVIDRDLQVSRKDKK